MQENVCIIYIFAITTTIIPHICIILLDTFTISHIRFFEKKGGNGDYMKYLL